MFDVSWVVFCGGRVLCDLEISAGVGEFSGCHVGEFDLPERGKAARHVRGGRQFAVWFGVVFDRRRDAAVGFF